MRTYTPDTSYSQYEYETNKEIQKLLSSQNTSPMKRKNSELAQKFMDIEQAKVALKNPLFGNRYIVFFSGAGSASRNLFSDEYGRFASTISMPTYTYNATLQYVGGVNIVIPNIHEQGQIDMTIYNTGDTYRTIQKWANLHYNPKKKTYGYVNDYLVNMKILELDRASGVILTHIFSGCTIYTYGGIQLTYEEATTVEVFNLSLQYRGYDLDEEKA